MIEGAKRLLNLKACPMKVSSSQFCVEDNFVYGMVSNAAQLVE